MHVFEWQRDEREPTTVGARCDDQTTSQLAAAVQHRQHSTLQLSKTSSKGHEARVRELQGHPLLIFCRPSLPSATELWAIEQLASLGLVGYKQRGVWLDV